MENDLPHGSIELQEILEKRLESLFCLREFQKQIGDKQDARVAFTQKMLEVTQEIVVIQKRLLDALEWEAEVTQQK